MPDCKTCRENRQSVDPVPYIAHESAMARQERTIKKLWIALMVSIVLWAVTVAGIVYYQSQFETVETTVTQDVQQETEAGGTNNFVGGDYNGTSESQNDNDNETPCP